MKRAKKHLCCAGWMRVLFTLVISVSSAAFAQDEAPEDTERNTTEQLPERGQDDAPTNTPRRSQDENDESGSAERLEAESGQSEAESARGSEESESTAGASADDGAVNDVSTDSSNAENRASTDAPEHGESEDNTAESESQLEQNQLERSQLERSQLEQGVRGRVVAGDSGAPLSGVPVVARNRAGDVFTTSTSETGTYNLELRPGAYDLQSYEAFHHGGVYQLRVPARRWITRDFVLDPIVEEELVVDEVEITYRANTSGQAATQALQQNAAGVQDVASAEAMSESGASDAAAGASRVAGVAIDGARPTIRGLSGSSVLVLLNGAPVPSTEPGTPGVDLDLFPTNVLSNLAVMKTMTANQPAAWAGGLVDIRTVQFPEERLFDLSFSVGVDHLASFRNQLDYDGGAADFTGFDQSRSLPNLPNERLTLSRNSDLTAEDIHRSAQQFENTWNYKRSRALPNLGFGLTFGNSHAIGREEDARRVGYLFHLAYDRTERRETGFNRARPTLRPDGSLAVFNDFDAEVGEEDVSLTAFATASADVHRDHTLSFVSLFNRTTSDEVERLIGRDAELDAGGLTERWQLRYRARTLFTTQLLGDHRALGPRNELRIRWTLFAGLGRRDEPDRRTVVYGPQGGQIRWLEKSGSGERFFSDLDQRDAGLNLGMTFPLWSTTAGEARLELGASAHWMSRSLLNRRFRMLQEQPPPADQGLYSAPAEMLFAPQNLGTLTRFREFTQSTDSYEARQFLSALYVHAETPIIRSLSLTAGARFELFDQSVDNRDPFENTDQGALGTERLDIDVLPSIALKQDLIDGMALRASYAMTVVRPQVRELAPYQYYDFQRDRLLSGNPELERMRVHHGDLRWEWFFSDSERVTVSVFYKHMGRFIYPQIRDPLTYSTQMINADSGWAVGGEVELALGLGTLHEALSNFSFYGNFALIHSQLDLPESLSGAVADQTRVPGQAPYVANLALRFEDEDNTGLSFALSYNVVGSRITDVGVLNAGVLLPNIERSPFHSLDFVASYAPSEHVRLTLKCRNLLFQSQDYRMGSFVERRESRGARFDLGLSLSL